MELIIGNRILQIGQPSANDIMKIIESSGDDTHYLSHLIVDGEEIYDNYEVYLNEHGSHIKELIAVTKTLDDFIHDNLQLTKNYLVKAIPTLSSLSESFYQNPSSSNWQELSNLFTGIEWLEKMQHVVEQTGKQPDGWLSFKEDLAKLQQQLLEMETALKNKDQVFIADLLQYEFHPLFMQLAESINKMLVGEEEQP
ncbi:MAG: hypothetical protein ABF651_11265 [Sporolactobacillus sp.]